jgi:hypothetical protein
MNEAICPRCGAPIDDEFLAVIEDAFECPSCGAPLRVADVAPQLLAARRRDGAPDVETHSPPGSSKLQCRTIGTQLVIFMPPGSARGVRSLGWFALFWLSFIGVFAGIILVANGFEGEALTAMAFLSVFWLVGFGMLYIWVRGRFGKTYVLVEADRAVRKSELFGREKFREHLLDIDSRASLVESYRENERPVYAIEISASGGNLRFGTFLTVDEKDWLVERINHHLARSSPTAQAAGASSTSASE